MSLERVKLQKKSKLGSNRSFVKRPIAIFSPWMVLGDFIKNKLKL